MYGGTDKAFATAYYHWFFLIQPFDLPERLIGADPIYYLHKKLAGWSSGLAALRPARACRIRALLRRSGDDPRDLRGLSRGGDDRSRARRGGCGSRVECPLLALWGAKGVVHRMFDPIADWKSVARDVSGKPVVSGHFLAEEAPEETLAELVAFFGG